MSGEEKKQKAETDRKQERIDDKTSTFGSLLMVTEDKAGCCCTDEMRDGG